MRVVLDTNVIVAAFATRGLCSEVFVVCLSDNTTIISNHIISEVKEKLISKVRLPQTTVDEIINYLKEIAEICKTKRVDKSKCRDIDDIKVIGTAISGNARFIITGDKDLLSLKKHGEIEIITPREFWSRLKGQ